MHSRQNLDRRVQNHEFENHAPRSELTYLIVGNKFEKFISFGTCFTKHDVNYFISCVTSKS